MNFTSIKNPADTVSFETALARGIPADGSLYFPKHIPQLEQQSIASLPRMNVREVGKAMLAPWVSDEIPDQDLDRIIDASATFETPVVSVGDKKVLELFHGPTGAFKDVAARYLASFMGYFNERAGRTSTVLVATSGDTGGAIAHGFGNVPGINVVVLYPKARVSRLQQEQLRRTANNIQSLEVTGDFDDCQRLVIQAFSDPELQKKISPTSANSISVGRLIPQTTYYGGAYSQLARPDMRMVVPTGNLGNLTAGVIAQQMGVPIAGFLAANNANNALYRLVKTGEYDPHTAIATASNAMDVGSPNNLPRLRKIFHNSVAELGQAIDVATVTDAETASTIKSVYENHGYLLDPHTAVAWHASDRNPSQQDLLDVIVSTATPLKFAQEIFELTGIAVDNTAELEKLSKIPESYSEIEASFDALRIFLLANAR